MTNVRINQTPEKKEQEKKSNQASKQNYWRNKEAIDDVAFREVENMSKVDHSILDTEAFRIIKGRFDEAVGLWLMFNKISI